MRGGGETGERVELNVDRRPIDTLEQPRRRRGERRRRTARALRTGLLVHLDAARARRRDRKIRDVLSVAGAARSVHEERAASPFEECNPPLDGNAMRDWRGLGNVLRWRRRKRAPALFKAASDLVAPDLMAQSPAVPPGSLLTL